MFHLPSSLLALNGFVALLLGLLCGAPLGSAINRGSDESIRGWRVAHSSLVNGGVMLLAISVVLPHLALSQDWRLVASILLSISVYVFSFALVFGAWKGYRGLRKETENAANVVYYANMLGAVLSIIVVGLLIYGASISLARNMLT